MTRNLKALGLALVAAFAMSAVVASAAQAEKDFHFWADEDHVELMGTQHASVPDVLTLDAGTLECTTIAYHGTVQSASTQVTTLTLKPTYSNCHAFFGSNVTIHTNTCGFLFHAGTYSNGRFEGNMDIECTTQGDKIVLTALGCRVTFPPQNSIPGTVTYTNVNSSPQQATSTKEITIDFSLTGIQYEEHNQGIFPTCATNTGGLKNNGTYTGAATVTAKNEAGNHVGIYTEQTP